MAAEPLAFVEIKKKLLADKGMAWIRQVISKEAAERNRHLAMENGPLRFRHRMLAQLDTIMALNAIVTSLSSYSPSSSSLLYSALAMKSGDAMGVPLKA